MKRKTYLLGMIIFFNVEAPFVVDPYLEKRTTHDRDEEQQRARETRNARKCKLRG